jgi:hypothetical protein
MSTQTDVSTSEAQVDFTKTRTYAITDLAIKAVSAAAIAVIGLASYCYQSHLEASKNLETEREKKAELLLPFLRSSSDLAVDLRIANSETGSIAAAYVGQEYA